MTALRIALMIAIGPLLASCGEKASTPKVARPVLSTIAIPTSVADIAVVGTVQPQFRTDFSFRMLGRLTSRPVNVGDTVAKDKQLASVDPLAAQLGVRSALADVSTAQSQSANSANTAERQRKLIETGATTKANLDSAEQGNASAQAAVTRAQANLTKAREQLSYTTVTANYPGVVTSIGAEVGQIVSPGQTVVTVARPDIREAVIDVADDVVGALQTGSALAVTLQLDPRVRVSGKVREIAPQSDAVTRSRRVRIALEQPPDTFRLGTTVVVLISHGKTQGYRLPASAILQSDGTSKVWVIDPTSSTVNRRDVSTGAISDGFVNVTTGLDPGVRVVTAGVNHLGEGQKVRLGKDLTR